MSECVVRWTTASLILSTICLAAVVFLLAGALAVALTLNALAPLNLLRLLAALAAVAVSLAGAVLAAYGVLQRRTIRPAGGGR